MSTFHAPIDKTPGSSDVHKTMDNVVQFSTSSVRRITFLKGCNKLKGHRGLKIFGIESGSAEGRLNVDGANSIGTLTRGSLFLAKDSQEIEVHVDRDCQAIVVMLEPSCMNTKMPDWSRMNGQIFRDRLIFEMLLRMYDEQRAPISDSPLLLQSAASLLVIALTVDELRSASTFRKQSKNAVLGLRRAIDWIEDNLSQKMTLQDLASVADLSEWYFLRQFKLKYDRSPRRYVQERRLAKAKELLVETKMPISQISYECGFSSQSHLTTTFKQYFGVTPGSCRTVRRRDEVNKSI